MTHPGLTLRAKVARLVGALVVWTLLSYGLISMFSGSNVCTILQPVGSGVGHSLTQAEMDAQTARCNRPNAGTLAISAAGYIAIVGMAAGLWLSPSESGEDRRR